MSARAALLGLLLLLPCVSAALPPVGGCTQYGCVHVQDTDGDGTYDWASAASSVDHALTLNANLHSGQLVVQADGSTEETIDPYHAATLYLAADADAREVWLLVTAYEGDEETGEVTLLVRQLVEVRDADGDGVPDLVLVPGLP